MKKYRVELNGEVVLETDEQEKVLDKLKEISDKNNGVEVRLFMANKTRGVETDFHGEAINVKRGFAIAKARAGGKIARPGSPHLDADTIHMIACINGKL